MEVERHEIEDARWAVARRAPAPALRPYLLRAPEGWEQARGKRTSLREVPFPGVPLILNLGTPWEIEDPGARSERRDSFVGGMHAAPSLVEATAATWACIELRLTPLGAHRVLGLPMHELANRTVELDGLLPHARDLTGGCGRRIPGRNASISSSPSSPVASPTRCRLRRKWSGRGSGSAGQEAAPRSARSRPSSVGATAG